MVAVLLIIIQTAEKHFQQKEENTVSTVLLNYLQVGDPVVVPRQEVEHDHVSPLH